MSSKAKVSYEELEIQVAELEETLLFLESKLSKAKKQIVLQRDIMIKHLLEGPKTIDQIASLMSITNKNVSSLKHQIINLRDENKNQVYEMLKDSVGRLHLMKMSEFKI